MTVNYTEYYKMGFKVNLNCNLLSRIRPTKSANILISFVASSQSLKICDLELSCCILNEDKIQTFIYHFWTFL